MNGSINSRLLFPFSGLLGKLLLAATFALVAFTPSIAAAVCGDSVIQAGEDCDDGNIVDGDCCDSNCKFEPVESFCTDNNECTVNFCDGFGSCSSSPDQGAPCDDDNSCTGGDVCNSDGFCGGTNLGSGSPCEDDGNACTLDQCSFGDFGMFCGHFIAQNASCDDGNPCTFSDTCNSDGFCIPQGTQQNGTTCTDGKLCGGTGFCFGGFCSGDPADCDGFGDACSSAVCNPQILQCEVTPLGDGTVCDNPSVCTEPGECSGGECIQPPVDCSAFTDACNDAFCDSEAQGCFSAPKVNGTVCDDGLCTEPGTCDDGECIDAPTDCSNFADQCNDAACNLETGCFALPKENGTSCDDGLFCTGEDACSSGACDHTGDPCLNGGICADSCNETTDSCLDAPGTVCRPSAGSCDVPETCDGSEATCPANAFASGGTTCRGVAGSCDVAETCNGSVATCPGNTFVTGGTTCRGAAGICDVAETCNGSAATCPGNTFVTGGTTCRASAGVCDVAETCNGSAAACPANSLATSGTNCRGAAGICDVAETCNGSVATCPGNTLVTGGTNCRGAAGICDVAETCNGSAATCPGNTFVTGGTTCRGTAGICDVAETCNGSAATCPGNTFVTSGATCRGAAGICDAAETCDGSVASCPADTLATSGTTCRGTAGICDVAESCDGSTATCPGNTLVTGGTTCRGTAGICDVAETCNGSAATCPADGFAASTTICRADAGDCDVADTCTGVASTCSGDRFESFGSPCLSDENVCTDDTCNGTGACQHDNNTLSCDDGLFCTASDACTAGNCVGSGDPCPGADGDGNCAESCDEAGNACTAADSNASPCSDGLFCTADDACLDGTCLGSGNPCPGADNDGNCTESCDETANECTAADPDNSTCDDGVACTTPDTCQAGACIAGQDNCSVCGNASVENGEVCDDGNTADGDCCSSTCQSSSSGNGCDDGVFCNGADTCQGGACTQHAGDPCTGADADGDCSETCDEEADACSGADPDESACDDGLFCTSGDTCTDGLCNGAPTCPPTEACEDTCDEANDACRTCGHPFSNSRCVVNAVVVLQGALDLRPCELCTCDVNADGQVTASDALMVLRTCVNLPTVLDCETPPPTTTFASTTSTTMGECPPAGALHDRTYTEKYTCVQTFTGGEPFCADQNVVNTIKFTHAGDGVYEVRDVPDTGFVLNGSFVCGVFVWGATSPDEYTESGAWEFGPDLTTFEGTSGYVALDESYGGVCNATGEEAPGVPPNPPTTPPCP